MYVGTALNRHCVEELLVKCISVKLYKINKKDGSSDKDELIKLLHQENATLQISRKLSKSAVIVRYH